MKRYCTCCARQLVDYLANDERIVGPGPFIKMGPNEFCCQSCGRDLDENGLFPEERDQAEAMLV